eukprot:TRINITY_DN214_c1_g1_i2.p2 TRINITY_DN214_c1_g1~~TRINITY_DN214_c1_g1_i2.p2  ORF type:complete len:106 (+),score=14.01 TRINITY_DN214_c1_g1_i2:22-339(+)
MGVILTTKRLPDGTQDKHLFLKRVSLLLQISKVYVRNAAESICITFLTVVSEEVSEEGLQVSCSCFLTLRGLETPESESLSQDEEEEEDDSRLIRFLVFFLAAFR